jgi:hypothetical protein
VLSGTAIVIERPVQRGSVDYLGVGLGRFGAFRPKRKYDAVTVLPRLLVVIDAVKLPFGVFSGSLGVRVAVGADACLGLVTDLQRFGGKRSFPWGRVVSVPPDAACVSGMSDGGGASSFEGGAEAAPIPGAKPGRSSWADAGLVDTSVPRSAMS